MRIKTKIDPFKVFEYPAAAEMMFRHERIWRARNEQGFIPMIIALVLIVVAVIWFVFLRVNEANE